MTLTIWNLCDFLSVEKKTTSVFTIQEKRKFALLFYKGLTEYLIAESDGIGREVW